MHGLKVEHWEQWEQLCCYFMQQFVAKNGHAVRYESYGSKGQSQFGIDLVPINSTLPVVGQCKLRESSLTWADVLAEVEKTDKYALPIQCYVVFTTANKHTTIQDQQNTGVYRHTRPDGTVFPVYVRYWSDVLDLSFIPEETRRAIFPNAFKLAASEAVPSNEAYLASLAVLQSYVPTRLRLADLNWIETFDFTKGSFPESSYEPFYQFYRDLIEVEDAVRLNINSWMHRAGHSEIQKSRLAGETFYWALKQFAGLVQQQIITETMPDGSTNYTVRDLQGWQRIARDFNSSARYLAEVYRSAILGQRNL